MPANLTEVEFSQHLNTKFHLDHEADGQVALELVQVKGYSSNAREQSGLERFSVFFVGPLEVKLPQHTYRLKHAKMGEFDIFLVPIGRNEQGFRYEAVFNYFK
jgi:uncharacterized protein DUF6916